MSNNSTQASNFSILHRIEVEAAPEKLYNAIAEASGLAAWWTPMVTQEGSGEGTIFKVRFGDGKHGADFEVEALEPNEQVQLRCVQGPWEGMLFHFEIQQHKRGAVLIFRNSGWLAQDNFFMHCNTKWGYFFAVSLKKYLEQGQGAPHPQDPSI